ncbi:MAG: GNAT family N-acetyltransferase [Oscillospiraceae bacterium]|nr:GNAT family N-acetyltransferase [Oscillospiraceae bacterium]
MIRFATIDELSSLRLLFKECFDVEFFSPYGSFYITNIFSDYLPLVYIYNNKIVSMLTLIPVNFKEFSGFYIWALGTLKDCRNKNIASKMLDFVFEYSKKSNIDFNILIPQNKDLYNFYFNRGFKKYIKQKMILIDKKSLLRYVEASDKVLDFNKTDSIFNLKEYRKKNYNTIDFISWEEKELIKIQKEITLPGSENYILDFKDGQYAILDLREIKNNKIKIREFYIFDFNFGSFLKTLLDKYFFCEFFEFLLPVSDKYYNFFDLDKEKYVLKNTAMLRIIDDKLDNELFDSFDSNEIYFNFGFDT